MSIICLDRRSDQASKLLGGRNWKRAAHHRFHPDSKTIVTDPQSLRSAIGAEAISSTHAYLIVRWSSWCLPFGIRCNRPRSCQVL